MKPTVQILDNGGDDGDVDGAVRLKKWNDWNGGLCWGRLKKRNVHYQCYRHGIDLCHERRCVHGVCGYAVASWDWTCPVYQD